MSSIFILQNSSYYDVLFNAILNAKRSIHLSIFSYNLSESLDDLQRVRDITKLLIQRKQAGIDVKVILGNSYKFSPEKPFTKLDISNEMAFTILKSFGVPVSFFCHYYQESSHSKYVLIDEELVFIGSHNFSPRAFSQGNDDSVCILDKELGNQINAIFQTDWKYTNAPVSSEMIDFNPAHFIFPNFTKRDYTVPEIKDTISHQLLLNENYFEFLIKEIDNSKKTISICMFYFSFTNKKDSITNKIYEALLRAHNNGVNIKIILDRDKPNDIYASFKANKKRYQQLKKIGIDVRFDSPNAAMHSKIVIIDEEKVLIGSHNWTFGSFDRYQDLSILINSKKLSEKFSEIFEVRFSLLN